MSARRSWTLPRTSSSSRGHRRWSWPSGRASPASRRRSTSSLGPRGCAGAPPGRPRPARGLVAAWGVAAALALAASLSGPRSRPLDEEFAGGPGDVVVVDPGRWVGKACPLLDYVDTDAPLREGEWTVVLYHTNCPRCREAAPAWEAEARRSAGKRGMILIAVPPFAGGAPDVVAGAGGLVRSGRLRPDREWFVQTPARFCLSGGRVVACPPDGWDEGWAGR